MSAEDRRTLARWRLVLGKFASSAIPAGGLSEQEQSMAEALELLYSREYKGRGVRQETRLGPGSLDPSQLAVPEWLAKIGELFPKETCQRITGHALSRYGLTDVLTDPAAVAHLEPSLGLLNAVLHLKGQVSRAVLAEVRKLVAKVVEDLRRRLEKDIRTALGARLDRRSHTRHRLSRNFDALGTIQRNLKHWDKERRRIVVENPRFFNRVKRHLPWEIILCVDQSGSMGRSVIHAAVMGGILSSLPLVRVRLVVFDTAVVDLTDFVADPVEVLLSVQLGGGTNIGQAVQYCEQLVSQPRTTILILVTDFCEGADERVLRAACRRLIGAGVRLLGLAALDEAADPLYDEVLAGALAAEGMEIAALTPLRLASWLSQVINKGSA
jgi:Mg-chelatase subunit ChlD